MEERLREASYRRYCVTNRTANGATSPGALLRRLQHSTGDWPILKEYEWAMGAHAPAYSEGMAEVVAEFARRTDWLISVAGVAQEEIECYTKALLPAHMLTRFFELLMNMRIELAAYAETPRDIAVLERELTREVRLLELLEGDAPQWEANTWYTSYPVYWQNYMLALLIASQVHETITERFGASASSSVDVSEYLRDNFYASGNAVPWSERVKRGTGKALSTEAYLRRIRRIDD